MSDTAKTDPIALLSRDAVRAEAAGDVLARRCFVATLSEADQPTLRTLVLRGLEAGRLELLFSATSPKWRDLLANGRYEVLVYWPSIQCQYRLRGGFEEIPFEEIAASWKQKSVDGKLLDLCYAKQHPQSSRIDDVKKFVATLDSIRDGSVGLDSASAPPTLGGIRLEPSRIERLDLSPAATVYSRHLFTRTASGWQRETLVP